MLVAPLNIFAKNAIAGDIQIEFTSDDSYSTEVAYIQIGDTIEWLPTNEGHNVEFLAINCCRQILTYSKQQVRH